MRPGNYPSQTILRTLKFQDVLESKIAIKGIAHTHASTHARTHARSHAYVSDFVKHLYFAFARWRHVVQNKKERC